MITIEKVDFLGVPVLENAGGDAWFGGAEFAQPSDAVKRMIRSFFVALLGAAPASRIS